MRLLTGAAALATVVIVAVVLAKGPGIGEVQSTVRAAGAWAPAVFVALQVALTLTPVPRTPFSIAAGVLFGWAFGLAVAIGATAVAAAGAFWMVRVAGEPFVRRRADRAAVSWVRARVDRSGLLAVLSLRLIPVLPFSVVNYAAGLSGVRFLHYLLGTLVGVVPGTTAVVVLGDAVSGGRPSSALLAVSIVCGTIGTVGLLV
ncbi:MAG TPA: VTT domain-containing protein, partial [Pseudonocardia sp.]|nr:VTT domain-containing protein [Pseudonocardia sp.]